MKMDIIASTHTTVFPIAALFLLSLLLFILMYFLLVLWEKQLTDGFKWSFVLGINGAQFAL